MYGNFLKTFYRYSFLFQFLCKSVYILNILYNLNVLMRIYLFELIWDFLDEETFLLERKC